MIINYLYIISNQYLYMIVILTKYFVKLLLMMNMEVYPTFVITMKKNIYIYIRKIIF